MQQRIRTTKPEFYRHYELFAAEQETGLPLRLAFQALWTCCDREGRFKWRPQELKILCLPYDDVDFTRVLEALEDGGFVQSYWVDRKQYGVVPSFGEHQCVNSREAQSKIPSPSDKRARMHAHAHACLQRPAADGSTRESGEKPGVKEGSTDSGAESGPRRQNTVNDGAKDRAYACARTHAHAQGELEGNWKGTGTGTSTRGTRVEHAGFESFWKEVHRKEGRGAASKAFSKAVGRVAKNRGESREAAAQWLTERMRKFAGSPQAADDVKGRIHPSTWLNQERYDDDDSIWFSGSDAREKGARSRERAEEREASQRKLEEIRRKRAEAQQA